MSRKKKLGMGDPYKRLHEWAEERLYDDLYTPFMTFAQREGYDPYDMLSDTEFLTLKEKFELED
jgi:hypothetical protein